MRDSMTWNKKFYQYFHLFSESMVADHGVSGKKRDQNDSKTFVFNFHHSIWSFLLYFKSQQVKLELKNYVVKDSHKQVKLHIIWHLLQYNENKIWSFKTSSRGI